MGGVCAYHWCCRCSCILCIVPAPLLTIHFRVAPRRHCSQNKCSVVRTYTGHGINSLFHTAPNVPHYAKNKAVGMMHPGQTFTIEPMVNAGASKDFTWPDDWTAVSQVRICLKLTQIYADLRKFGD